MFNLSSIESVPYPITLIYLFIKCHANIMLMYLVKNKSKHIRLKPIDNGVNDGLTTVYIVDVDHCKRENHAENAHNEQAAFHVGRAWLFLF